MKDLWKIEFPNLLNDLDLTFLDGFSDESWHNDVCPRFVKPLNDKYDIVVSIDDIDPEKREDENYQRFCCQICERQDDEHISWKLIYNGNDLNELKKVINNANI